MAKRSGRSKGHMYTKAKVTKNTGGKRKAAKVK
jgi:hypothetical protein